MTLLITVFAALITTLLWYTKPSLRILKIGTLCLMFWGASLMWMVDAIFEFKELGADYFTPSAADMLNDSFLGMSVVALGLMIWTGILLIKDPKGIFRLR